MPSLPDGDLLYLSKSIQANATVSSPSLSKSLSAHVNNVLGSLDHLHVQSTFATRLQKTFNTRTLVLFRPVFAIADDAGFQVNAVVIYGVYHRGRNISRLMADCVNFNPI